MTGSERRPRKRRAFVLSAPRSLLSQLPDQCFLARRSLSCFSRLEPDPRNGLSLACNGCTFRCPHSRVNGPGLLLRLPASSLPARSAFRSATGPGSPRFRPPHRFCPLRLHALTWLAAPPASTPLRDFYLPRDQSVQQNLPPAGSPSEPARSPLAPRSPLLLLDSATDHRPRSATFPEAGCSSNLLEPHSLCA